MARLRKQDIVEMDRAQLETLDHARLLGVAWELRELCLELWERLDQDSHNSSKPPSSDSPYKKRRKDETLNDGVDVSASSTVNSEKESATEPPSTDHSESTKNKRNAGKQPGAKGFWRSQPLVAEKTIPHYPELCEHCKAVLEVAEDAKPYMGHHVLELEKTDQGVRISCSLHHYYSAVCVCGQETKSRPGEGYVSHLEGRKTDLKLTEYVLVGPYLATFVAALSNRYRMSRTKIKEFLAYWLNTELSVGTIDRCIREAGIACQPVVEELIEELQEASVVGLDETPWHENGRLRWLWVAVSAITAVYFIGTRKKEELLRLISETFMGWLVTDGYGVYRDRERRQRCLAHLIRKAIALTGLGDEKARRMGEWLLRELRELIRAVAEEGEDAKRKSCPILARLKRACNLGAEGAHPKLRALAREILNDWDAVVAFVKNPHLPPTNNDAERILRHAVISRRISFGTRTSEGSEAYAALLSVIETCRLRNVDPWTYIAQTIALARKGQPHISIPTATVK